MKTILVPHFTANEDVVVLNEQLIANNQLCRVGDLLATLESTKATFELEAEDGGFIYFIASEGDELRVGSVLAYLDDAEIDPSRIATEDDAGNAIVGETEGLIVTRKAGELLAARGIEPTAVKNSGTLKEADVREYLAASKSDATDAATEVMIDPEVYAPFEAAFKSMATSGASLDDLEKLKATLALAVDIYEKRWQRRIPAMDVLFDRWSNATANGFGKDSNIAHSAHVTGDVKIGRNTFVGPNAYLDGSGGLSIGDHCSIAVGVQIYSHDTVARALSGHRAEVVRAPTRIGNACFIGPGTVITKGVIIGDHCFVAANSLVTASLPDYSAVMGVPAQRIGTVQVDSGGNVKIAQDKRTKSGGD
jgi:acetyltransferase-like isoleucine patch superfamily enzyme